MTDESPRLSVVIPTRNRYDEVGGAVESGLGQSLPGVEVIVVDDASDPPVELSPHPRLRVLRLDEWGGLSAARNAGAAAAAGHWLTFLDDDNRLLPDMAERSLAALEDSTLPPPVAVVSALEMVGEGGRVLDRRIPPTHPRGDHFSLEPAPGHLSHMTKATLVVERALFLGVGGFDPTFPSREMSDLFFRLNPICSIEGIAVVTQRATRTPGPRGSRDPAVLERGFRRMVEKHRDLLESHPAGYADALLGHVRMSLVAGPRRAAVPALLRALRVAPAHTLGVVLNPRRAVRMISTWSSSG
jgi:glycosyltransferase involved in cell wall biosynthesis